MKQEYANALRKIRTLVTRLFNETDAFMEKMEKEGRTAGCVEVREEDEEILRVVGILHNDAENGSAEIETLCNDLGID